MPLPQADIDYLNSRGLDPNEYELDATGDNYVKRSSITTQPATSNTDFPQPKLTPQTFGPLGTAAGTFVHEAPSAVTGGLGFAQGAKLGSKIPGPPWAKVAGGLAGGVAAGMGAGGATRAIQGLMENELVTTANKLTDPTPFLTPYVEWLSKLSASQAANPKSTVAGSIATMPLAGMSPSVPNATRALGYGLPWLIGRRPPPEQIANIANVGIGALLQPAIGVGQRLATGEPITAKNTALDLLIGLLFNKPNLLGKKYGFSDTPFNTPHPTPEVVGPAPAVQTMPPKELTPTEIVSTGGAPFSHGLRQVRAEEKGKTAAYRPHDLTRRWKDTPFPTEEELARMEGEGRAAPEPTKQEPLEEIEGVIYRNPSEPPEPLSVIPLPDKPVEEVPRERALVLAEPDKFRQPSVEPHLRFQSEEAAIPSGQEKSMSFDEVDYSFDAFETRARLLGKAILKLAPNAGKKYEALRIDPEEGLGKSMLEGLAKNDPGMDRVWQALLQKGLIDVAGSNDWLRQSIAHMNTVREINGRPRLERHFSEEAAVPPQQRRPFTEFEKEISTKVEKLPPLNLARWNQMLANWLRSERGATSIDVDTKLPVAGETVMDWIGNRLKKMAIKLGPKSGFETLPHEGVHGFFGILQTSPSAFDRMIVNKGYRIVENLPEFKAINEQRIAQGRKPWTPNEFLTTETGIEYVARQMKLQGETELKQWWNDLKNHIKVRFSGKELTQADLRRYFNYRYQTDAAFKRFAEGGPVPTSAGAAATVQQSEESAIPLSEATKRDIAKMELARKDAWSKIRSGVRMSDNPEKERIYKLYHGNPADTSLREPRHLTIIEQQKRQGLSDAAILYTLRKNMVNTEHPDVANAIDRARSVDAVHKLFGATRQHNVGDIVTYDPLVHEDTVGGMMQNDQGIVVHPGLTYKGQNILRAQVKPANVQQSEQSSIPYTHKDVLNLVMNAEKGAKEQIMSTDSLRKTKNLLLNNVDLPEKLSEKLDEVNPTNFADWREFRKALQIAIENAPDTRGKNVGQAIEEAMGMAEPIRKPEPVVEQPKEPTPELAALAETATPQPKAKLDTLPTTFEQQLEPPAPAQPPARLQKAQIRKSLLAHEAAQRPNIKPFSSEAYTRPIKTAEQQAALRQETESFWKEAEETPDPYRMAERIRTKFNEATTKDDRLKFAQQYNNLVYLRRLDELTPISRAFSEEAAIKGGGLRGQEMQETEKLLKQMPALSEEAKKQFVKVQGFDSHGNIIEREMRAEKAMQWLDGKRSILKQLLDCLAGR